MADTGDKVTRKYSNFRGVDFRGEECNLNRSPDSLNMWRDYSQLSSIETRPGLNLFAQFATKDSKRIKSMMWHKDCLYFLETNGDLWELDKNGEGVEIGSFGKNAFLFKFGGDLYVAGFTILCIKGRVYNAGDINDNNFYSVSPFIPTTTIGRKPSGGGTTYQDVNLLTDSRKNSFVCDGVSKVFYLDATDLSENKPTVVINGVELKKNEKEEENWKYKVDLLHVVDIRDVSTEAIDKISRGVQTSSWLEWSDNSNATITNDPEPGYVYLMTNMDSLYASNISFKISNLPSNRTVKLSDINIYDSLVRINIKLNKTTNDGVACIVENDIRDVIEEGITTHVAQASDGNSYICDEVEIVVLNGGGGGRPEENPNQNAERNTKISFKMEIVDVDDFVANADDGTITFVGAPPPPLTDGQDNLVVEFEKENEGAKQKILGCTMAQEFDGRMFFSGNPDHPSTIWHSALNDVSYFSDLDYYVDGADGEPIRSMVPGNNGLWVFRDVQASNNGVFYHTPSLDEQYGKVYPSSHSSISIGCSGRAINFNDDIVFFSPRGMEGISTDIASEQFATHRSSLVDRVMVASDGYKDMQLVEWKGYLLVFIGKRVFLADSRAVLQNENHIEYEWFYWELQYKVTCATVYNDVLYIATEIPNESTGAYILKFDGDPLDGDYNLGTYQKISSHWTTPKDYFNAPNKLKSTNKKGCVIEAVGNVGVLVKTDDYDGYDLAVDYTDVTDYLTGHIKRKKFKDIQLKFSSDESFRLESATLEAFIGGYIKR